MIDRMSIMTQDPVRGPLFPFVYLRRGRGRLECLKTFSVQDQSISVSHINVHHYLRYVSFFSDETLEYCPSGPRDDLRFDSSPYTMGSLTLPLNPSFTCPSFLEVSIVKSSCFSFVYVILVSVPRVLLQPLRPSPVQNVPELSV